TGSPGATSPAWVRAVRIPDRNSSVSPASNAFLARGGLAGGDFKRPPVQRVSYVRAAAALARRTHVCPICLHPTTSESRGETYSSVCASESLTASRFRSTV